MYQHFVLTILLCLGLYTGCLGPSRSGGNEELTLELDIDQGCVVPDEPVNYKAEWVHRNGEREPVTVQLTSDVESGLRYTDSTITPTAIGEHTLTATATSEEGSYSANATLIVSDGLPASIELSLSDDEPEIDRSIEVSAIIRNACGKELEEPWTLTVAAEPGYDVSSVNIVGEHYLKFTQEGWYSAVGTIDANGISNYFGPFAVDSYGPVIDITHPRRGHFTGGTSGTICGTVEDNMSDIASLTVNGEPLPHTVSGSFSHPLSPYVFGTNIIETLATDTAGSVGTDRRAVLSGDFFAYGKGIENGVIVRINESTFHNLEILGEGLIADTDMAGMIHNPIISDRYRTCFLGLCVTFYSLELRANNLRVGGNNVVIDPRPDYIHASMSISGISVDWNAYGVLAEIPYSASGNIRADSITVELDVTPSISDGRIHSTVSNIEVTSRGFSFDLDGWIYDAATFFGLDASGLIRDMVEDTLRDTVADEVPALLEETLQDLELTTDFEIMENTYTVFAQPHSVTIDNSGLTLSLESFVAPFEWRLDRPDALGSLYGGYSPPEYDRSQGMTASFSADFLNQALFAFWGGGLLEHQFEGGTFDSSLLLEMLGDTEISQDLIGLFLDILRNTEVLVVTAHLPPVVMPSESDSFLFDLQIADLEVAVFSGDPTNPDNILFRIFMGFDAGLNLLITEDSALSPVISIRDSWVDVTDPLLPHDLEPQTEELTKIFMPALTNTINDALGEIPIPEISGFTLGNLEFQVDGAEGGYVSAGGELLVP